MSGSKFEGWSQQQIRDYFDAQREKSLAEFAGRPLPEISRVKREDYPHFEFVGCDFHVTGGKRVLVDRGDGEQVEGVLRGLRDVGGQQVLVVDLDGSWATERADGQEWAPVKHGRVRVDGFRVEVVARGLDDDADDEPLRWTLQTNMEGQP